LNNGQVVDRRIYKDLMEMLQTTKKEGLNLLICSFYRTQKKQEYLYKNKVNQYLNQGYSKTEDLDKAVFLGSKIKNKWTSIRFNNRYCLYEKSTSWS